VLRNETLSDRWLGGLCPLWACGTHIRHCPMLVQCAGAACKGPLPQWGATRPLLQDHLRARHTPDCHTKKVCTCTLAPAHTQLPIWRPLGTTWGWSGSVDPVLSSRVSDTTQQAHSWIDARGLWGLWVAQCCMLCCVNKHGTGAWSPTGVLHGVQAILSQPSAQRVCVLHCRCVMHCVSCRSMDPNGVRNSTWNGLS
jgi:hypothetical protein